MSEITENSAEEKTKKKKKKKAFGLIDRVINKMPEIHIPGYQYCGPGTKLEKRLERGDPGINKLDVACKDHDIAYATCEDTKSRRKADKALIARAFKRVFSGDAKLDERTAALLVSGLMSAKMGLTKIGLGLGARKKKRTKRRKKRRKRGGVTKKGKYTTPFRKIVSSAKESIKKSKSDSLPLNKTIMAAIRSAKSVKGRKKVVMPRVLKLPKFGGGSILPILPILSGLSAIGSITATAAGVMKAIKNIERGEKRIGHGLDLIAEGSGFYLKPFQHSGHGINVIYK